MPFPATPHRPRAKNRPSQARLEAKWVRQPLPTNQPTMRAFATPTRPTSSAPEKQIARGPSAPPWLPYRAVLHSTSSPSSASPLLSLHSGKRQARCRRSPIRSCSWKAQVTLLSGGYGTGDFGWRRWPIAATANWRRRTHRRRRRMYPSSAVRCARQSA